MTIKKRKTTIRDIVSRQARGICRNPSCKAWCGDEGVVHHKYPLSLGGRDTISNCVFLCKQCHKEIHSRGMIFYGNKGFELFCSKIPGHKVEELKKSARYIFREERKKSFWQRFVEDILNW